MTWQPLANGTYRAANPKDYFEIDDMWLTVTEILVEGLPGTASALIALPDGISLCRQVPDTASVSVPVEIEQVITRALKSMEGRIEDSMRRGYNGNNHWFARIDAALAWLDAQKGGTDV